MRSPWLPGTDVTCDCLHGAASHNSNGCSISVVYEGKRRPRKCDCPLTMGEILRQTIWKRNQSIMSRVKDVYSAWSKSKQGS